MTEAEVGDNCLAAVRASGGRLIVADFAPRNVERLIAFLHVAREVGRRLLVQPRDAYLLAAMHLAEPDAVPNLHRESCMAVYDDPQAKHPKWEQVTRQRYTGSFVRADEVSRNRGDYILAFSLWDMADLLDVEHNLGGVPGGTYIYSSSPGYDEEQEVDLRRLWKWIEHLDMEPIGLQAGSRDGRGRVTEIEVVPGYHASGHADGPQLLQFVKTVCPRLLIPVHTEQPEWWVEQLRGSGTRVVSPACALPINL